MLMRMWPAQVNPQGMLTVKTKPSKRVKRNNQTTSLRLRGEVTGAVQMLPIGVRSAPGILLHQAASHGSSLERQGWMRAEGFRGAASTPWKE